MRTIAIKSLVLAIITSCSSPGGDNPDKDGLPLADQIHPTLKLSNDGGYFTNNNPIKVTAQFSETVNGIDVGDFTVTGGTKANFAGENGTYTFDINPSGTLTTVKVALNEGSGTDAEGHPIVVPPNLVVIYDAEKPTEPTIGIKDGVVATQSMEVTLALSAIESSQMYVTNTENCTGDGTWEAYATERAWTLTNANADNKIYAKYRDQAHNESDCVTVTVANDTVAPTDASISIHAAASHSHTTTPTLTLAATGASAMYITNTAGCGSDGTYETYATSKTWTLPNTNASNTIYVKFRDLAGNETSCVSDDITHDGQAPTDLTSLTLTSGFGTVAGTIASDGTHSGWIVIRNTAAISDTPTTGTTYAAADTIGTSTVVYSGAETTFTDTPPNTGILYYYAAFSYDAAKNYSGVVTASSFTLPGGTIDTNWNSTGYDQRNNLGGGNSDDRLYDVEIDSAGRSVVCGHTTGTADLDLLVMRFTADGSLDTSFNTDGIYTADFDVDNGNDINYCFDVYIDSAGSIFLTGSTGLSMVIWKLNSSGELDTSFGTNGYVSKGISSTSTVGYSLAEDSGGNLYASGYSINGSSTFTHAMWKFSSAGVSDTSWQSSGTKYLDDARVVDWHIAWDLKIDSSDNIFIAGYSATSADLSDSHMVVWKYSTAGSLDTTFSDDGIYTSTGAAGGTSDAGLALQLDSSGRPVIAGFSASTSNGRDVAIWRLTTAGALDTSFNSTGYITHNGAAGGTGVDLAYDVHILATGQIAAAGYSTLSDASTNMAVWMVTSAGALATSYNSTGYFTHDLGSNEQAHGLAVDLQGRLIVAGFTNFSTVADTGVWAIK